MDDTLERLIEQQLRDGGSDKGIARQLGVDWRTVARRRKALGLPGYLTNAASPHCRHGHPFPENLKFNNRGHLLCTACHREVHRRLAQAAAAPDDVAVERAVAGDPPPRLTHHERRAAVLQLDAWGYSADQIAARVGCTTRTVYRIRARRRNGYAAAA
jgi:DNA-binding NarL/FixJ family response regulator